MRQLPLMLALAASLAGVCPASAQTHRFGVEDLIKREGVGQVRSVFLPFQRVSVLWRCSRPGS